MKIKSDLIDLIFPPLCLHCQKIVEKKGAIFCDECSFFFEPLDVMNRCPWCFSESERKRPCKLCKEGKRWHFKMASTIEALGPCLTLIHNIQKRPYLAKTAASLMMLQFSELNWPLPDCIMIFPEKLKDVIFYGKGASFYIAKEFAKLLNIPFKKKGRDQTVLVISDIGDYEKSSFQMQLIMNQFPKKAYLLALGHVDVAKKSDTLINA